MKTLSPCQEKGVTAIRSWFEETDGGHFYLGGYAGTGKTTIIPNIIDQCSIRPEEVSFIAPTGKAAKVITSKIRQDGLPNAARTIHSTIYRPERFTAEKLEGALNEATKEIETLTEGTSQYNLQLKAIKQIKRDLGNVYKDDTTPRFQFNPSAFRDSNTKLIICDEASMVGTEIAEDLLSFGIPVLAIGDPGQLTPIGDDQGLMLEKPDFFLDEIHRQAQDSPIIRLATMARQGTILPYSDYGDGVQVIKRRNDDVTYDVERDLQVIVGKNHTRWNVTARIRKECGYQSNTPQAGEPLMVAKNSKHNKALINGTSATCTADTPQLEAGQATVLMKFSVDDDPDTEHEIYVSQGVFEEHVFRKKMAHTLSSDKANYWARAENEAVDFGWVITAHKSQGSQWEEICVHDESGVFRGSERNWLYTAITRAEKRLTVVR